jgi:Na+/H+ antiporter NhaD/arsenite permease-like protein
MMIIGLPLAAMAYRKRMAVNAANKERIMRARPALAILDRPNLIKSLVVFAIILVGFFVSHAAGIEPGIIALAGALVMALVCKTDLHHALEKVEWNSVFFFIGLFMLIGALEHNGVFEALGHLITDWTRGNFLLTVMTILWFSAVVSAIVDNIPLVIAMIPLIQSIIQPFATELGVAHDPALVQSMVAEPLYWSLALGACLGGNGSLVGASANVVAAQIGRRNGVPFTFMAFTRMGLPVMLATCGIASIYLYLRYFF